jgi:Protein of unknown function (DUF3108)
MFPRRGVAGVPAADASAAPRRSQARSVALLWATLVATALHMVIVAGFDGSGPAPERYANSRVVALSVRELSTGVGPAAADIGPLAQPQHAAEVVAKPGPAPRRARIVASAVDAPIQPAVPDHGAPRHAADIVTSAAAAALVRDVTTAFVSSIEPPAAMPAREIPLYATRIPPSTTLHYRLRRGALQGEAELRWHSLGERYHAQLQASVAGAPLFRQSSEGELDATGLAPERFTDQRARRGTRAISFQRESRQVSFSSVPGAIDLGMGMQDRLSWIAQLAAVASAEPKRLEPGGEIVLVIVGTRGDTSPWRFVSHGSAASPETSASPPIHLQRLAASTYDTTIDVWLEPAPPHWPVRAAWRNGPADPGLELWRLDAGATR